MRKSHMREIGHEPIRDIASARAFEKSRSCARYAKGKDDRIFDIRRTRKINARYGAFARLRGKISVVKR